MDNTTDIIAAAVAQFGVVGIRITDDVHQVGDVLAPSYVWTDGDRTDEQLSGTCALGLDRGYDLDEILEISSSYYGITYIVAGDQCTFGDDEAEIIIPNAVVVAKL